MIFGRRYRVTEKIGAGGMAQVYKAVDEVLGRTVAVKVLHARYAADPTFAARFRQEAQAAANLQSPYIVNIYDWGQDGDTYYIVMELVRGTDLKTIIQQKGALPSSGVAEIGAQVCSALISAHGYDVIHRDIKPHNIMVTPDGSVKVMDFGIARAGNTTMTQTGSVLGTAHYVSPEQAQGRPLGAQSDLYSLGVVLYEAATGRLPFDADTPVAVALKQVNEQAPAPRSVQPDVDPGLEAVILKAMAKSPAERYDSADDMRRDLLNVVQGKPVAAAAALAGAAAAAGAVDAGAAEQTAVLPQAYPASGTTPPPAAVARRQPAKKRPVWPWVLLAAVLIAAGLGTAWRLGMFEPAGVAVPDLVGQTRAEAEAYLTEAGFVLGEVTERNDDTVEPGIVLEQSPDAETTAERGSAIDIVVSIGPELVTVPTITELDETAAQEALSAAGLTPSPQPDQFSPDVPAGTVISQDPEPGTEVNKGSAVRYVVSRGPETSKVPNVVGKKRADAEKALRDAGFKVSVKESFNNTVAAGIVSSQNPSAGLAVEKNSTVTIVVSRGPQTVTVPDVRGQPESDARAAIEAAGLKPEVVYELATDSGVVLDQSPAGGTKVNRGSTVTITVDGNGGGGGGGN